MHTEVMRWFQAALDRSEVEGKTIAEVGARDHNGTVRDFG